MGQLGWVERMVRAWPIGASAILLLSAFPPLNLGLLVFLALVPWFLSLRDATPWGAARSGYLFGMLFWLYQMHLVQSIVLKWTGSFGLSLVPYGLAALLGSFYFAFMGWAIRTCWKRGAVWLVPAIWAGLEVVRSYMPNLAFPWGLLATPLHPYPELIQLAHYGTLYLVSAWVALANVWIARLVAGHRFRIAMPGISVFVLLLVVSLLRMAEPVLFVPKLIAIGQPGIDLAYSSESERSQAIAERIPALIEQARSKHAELLLLPEGLVRIGPELPPALPFEMPTDMAVLLGAQRGFDKVYQSAIGFDGKWTSMDKKRLVVFGEYVPFREYIPFLGKFRLPIGDIQAAESVEALDLAGMRVGPLICFDAMFYDVALEQAKNRSQLLAALVIDDWYFGTAAPDQLQSVVVWRAIETGLPVARAGSLGISLVVDPRGRVIGRAEPGSMQLLTVNAPVPEGPDLFPLIEAVPWALGLMCLAPVLLAFWGRWAQGTREADQARKPGSKPGPDDAAR